VWQRNESRIAARLLGFLPMATQAFLMQRR